MITDEQGRKWLLQKLYDNGLGYVVMDELGNTLITDKKPFDNVNEAPIGCYKKSVLISGGITIFPNVEKQKVYDIEEELGIVDWTNVKVDTPILVKDYEEMNFAKRHFAFFKDGKVYAWTSGVTSWSAENNEKVVPWLYAELAEV